MSIKVIVKEYVDRFVGDYQDTFSAYSQIAHIYPSSSAVLEFNGMTTTSNIQYQLIKAYIEPRLKQYLQQKEKESTNKVHCMAWNFLILGQ